MRKKQCFVTRRTSLHNYNASLQSPSQSNKNILSRRRRVDILDQQSIQARRESIYPGKKNVLTGRIHSTSDWPFSSFTLSMKGNISFPASQINISYPVGRPFKFTLRYRMPNHTSWSINISLLNLIRRPLPRYPAPRAFLYWKEQPCPHCEMVIIARSLMLDA